jgi:hypothetical protein
MDQAPRPLATAARPTSAEDLGQDVLALVAAAETRGHASLVRRVDGVPVRLIVEMV